jgi:hypothetical protein
MADFYSKLAKQIQKINAEKYGDDRPIGEILNSLYAMDEDEIVGLSTEELAEII